MPRMRLAFAAVCAATYVAAVAACVGDDPGTTGTPPQDGSVPESSAPDVASLDGAVEAEAPRCRDEDAFDKPVELANLGGSAPGHVRLTADETEIYFQHGTASRLMVARRASANVAFEPPQFIDTSALDGGTYSSDPTISGDGLTLLFHASGRLAKMTRPDRQSALGSAQYIGLDEPGYFEEDPHLLGDKRALYFIRRPEEGGANTVWRSASGPAGFETPTAVVLLGISPNNPSPSDDELSLYYSEGAANRIQRVTRASTATNFGAPSPVPELDTADIDAGGSDRPGWLSPDKCRMYLVSGAGSATRAYVASRKPR